MKIPSSFISLRKITRYLCWCTERRFCVLKRIKMSLPTWNVLCTHFEVMVYRTCSSLLTSKYVVCITAKLFRCTNPVMAAIWPYKIVTENVEILNLGTVDTGAACARIAALRNNKLTQETVLKANFGVNITVNNVQKRNQQKMRRYK